MRAASAGEFYPGRKAQDCSFYYFDKEIVGGTTFAAIILRFSDVFSIEKLLTRLTNHTPVLQIKVLEMTMRTGMKILLAVDGSDCSLVAVDEIAKRPWPVGSCVKILSVVESPFLPTTDPWALPTSYYSEQEKAGKEQAEAVVSRAETRIRESQGAALEVITQTNVGHTVSEILDEAEAWGTDLIVLGSHGYHGLKSFLLGSVSSAVASHANCPVEIVRCRQAKQSWS